jgi:pimeloyl-ACP methyl ester carboxylesterase
MQFARINGITIHFRVDGPENAPSLVFINSLGTDFRIWDDVVDRLSGIWR